MTTRMNRSNLLIGTYILAPYARTNRHISDLAACGIDFVVGVNCDRNMLDLLHQHQIGAVVNDVLPGWWGGDGSNAGKMQQQNKLPRYQNASKCFTDHPAIWGIDIGDEASAADHSFLGHIATLTQTLFPHQIAYTNLYPSYGHIAQNTLEEALHQLGTASYRDYIESYCRCVPLDYVCYDHYLYTSSPECALRDLHTVADVCRHYKRSLWIVLQVNSNDPTHWLSVNQLRFQAYSAMAYGAEVILWACYTAGWFHNQVLDSGGNPTEQYPKLLTVNHELKHIGRHYMNYQTVNTHHVTTKALCLFDGIIANLRSQDGSHLIIGEMRSRIDSHSCALMICAADDPMDTAQKTHTIHFQSTKSTMQLITGTNAQTLHPNCDGIYQFSLPSNHGALLCE